MLPQLKRTPVMLLLREDEYKSLAGSEKTLYLLQWLQELPQAIRDTDKAELKSKEGGLVLQLQWHLAASLGPPLRGSLAAAFVALYHAGHTLSLQATVGRCCDIIKSKEEAAGAAANKLTALECLGAVYQHHGRMAGPTFPDTVQTLVRAMRTQEYRSAVLDVLRRLVIGLGPSSSSAHKDIYKCIKSGLADKSMVVRSAASQCGLELAQSSTFLYLLELDSVSTACLRALDGSSYEVRCSVARLLGSLLALTQKPVPASLRGRGKAPTLDDALAILSNGFIRGASGFLKAGGPELLKSGSASREVRVGVTQTYVVFLSEMGGAWVEQHLPAIARHLLDLVAHPRTIATHIDAVYSRKCVTFILRNVFGRLLGESAQLVAARHLCQLVSLAVSSSSSPSQKPDNGERGKSVDTTSATGTTESSGSSSKEKDKSLQQHAVICSILEIGALVYTLNTAALPLVVGEGGGAELDRKRAPLLEALHCVFLLPQLAARLAGAWCMHCIGLALPSQLSRLVDYCLTLLRGSQGSQGSSLEAVSGYCSAVAALLGTVRYSKLGIPPVKARDVLSVGQQLVAAGLTEEDSPSLATNRLQSGWALVGAFISLGVVHVRPQLRQLLGAWRGAFPHSMRELSSEQASGSLKSWLVSLENRAGALSSIVSFIKFCSDLLTPELTRRLMLPLDSALAMLSGLPTLTKTHGVQLKAGGAMLRLRLYQAMALLPPSAYEGSLSALLRELVTEFTLADNLASTTTSLLRSMCHHDDSILLGSWLEETDQQAVEEQLQRNSAAGCGSLEHDAACIFMTDTKGAALPGPLPLGVAVIDTAIMLFGQAFPSVALKHRQQLLTHFRESIRQAKSARQQSIQINIFTAFLVALKNLVDTKSVLGQQDILTNAYGLISSAVANSDPMLRCAAGEALGRMSQVGGDASFVAQIAQTSFDCLKSSRDVPSRTGHSLVLGCLHRYVGGMGSGQHLQTSVSVLHSLAQESSAPTQQVWALHALALIADSGGPMFRNYVESTLTLMLSLLVATPLSSVEVHQCLGKCVSALITTLGPELQDTSQSMNGTRKTCLTCCTIVQEHPDAIVQSAAIRCLQQLQLFAPQYVSLASLVPRLCDNINSPHLLLRRAAANCLRQFTQREPKAIWTITSDGSSTGLEHTVLSKLDVETDPKLCEDLAEILFSLLTSLAPEDPMKWLLLCNSVLSASSRKSGAPLPSGGVAGSEEQQGVEDEDEMAAKFTTGEPDDSKAATSISPRWPTKVFAVECSRKVYAVCKSDPAHFDLSLAQRRKRERGGDYLVMHLSELVRTSFIAATASVDQLKLAGYEALRDVIELFASTPDPDYQGHVLLEQYQAQIGAALRPAFTADTAPHVTAMACQVCSEWLGSGVSRNVTDLKRVQQLLVSSLEKLDKERKETSIYGEAVATMESLAVLKAWAELYVKVSDDSAKELQSKPLDDVHEESSSAMSLLDPHLPGLSQFWLAALKDHAYLSLPSHFSKQLPASGGAFYSTDVMEGVQPYYASNWPSLLHAAAIWLEAVGLKSQTNSSGAFEGSSSVPSTQPFPFVPAVDARQDRFHLVLGLAVQALCASTTLDQPLTLLNCLKTLLKLFQSPFGKAALCSDPQIAIEIFNILHRLLLTCPSHSTHVLVLEIAMLVGGALQKGSQASDGGQYRLETSIRPGQSCAYAILELSACCLLRLIPNLKPEDSQSSVPTLSASTSPSLEEQKIISQALLLLALTSSLCTAEACATVLPPVLHMLLSTLCYTSSQEHPSPTAAGLQALSQLCSSLPLSSEEEEGAPQLRQILHSALVSVLGVGPAGGEEHSLQEMDDETRMLVTVLLLRADARVCPPGSQLFTSCVQLCRKCLHSGSAKLQLKALQTCRSLFQSQETSTNAHFIQALGPDVVRLVQDCAGKAVELSVGVEATQLLETLLDLTPTPNKAQMMGLVIPLLISSLLPAAAAAAPPPSQKQRQFHEHVLKRVTQIGPKFPEAFRSVMQASPALRQRLEGAVRASHTPSKPGPAPSRARTQQAPSIKLKMDFSNFK